MELDAIRLCEKLNLISDDVWLVCKENSFIHREVSAKSEVSNWHSVKFFSMFSLSLILKLRAFILENKINNVIFFGASEMRSIYFSLLGMDINLIVRHGTTKRRKKKDLFHRFIYSKVLHYVGISKHLLNNIYDVLPVSEQSEVNLIYSSLQFPAVSKKAKIEKNVVVNIVHVGRLAPGKGQDAAIRACSGLFEADVKFKFVLIGSDYEDYKSELQNILNDLSYKESVFFSGHVRDVFSLLEKSDIFLFPSAGEGMPNSLIEALASGLVCIVYSNTVFPEFLGLGFYLHLVEDGNEEELKEKLLYVYNNLDVELEKSRINVDLTRKLFSEEREIEEYNRILI